MGQVQWYYLDTVPTHPHGGCTMSWTIGSSSTSEASLGWVLKGWWNSQEKMETWNKYDLALAYVSIFFGVTIQWIHTVVYYRLIEVRGIDSQAVNFLEPQTFTFPPDTRSCSNWIHWNSCNFWLYWLWHHPLQPMVVWDGNEKDMPQMLHVWNIYLQNWAIFGVNVGKYSSTMEHLGWRSFTQRFPQPVSPIYRNVWFTVQPRTWNDLKPQCFGKAGSKRSLWWRPHHATIFADEDKGIIPNFSQHC